MNHRSGLLFARRGILDGIARLVDLGGTLCETNSSLTEDQADFLATRQDWRSVEDDLRKALIQFAEEHQQSLVSI